VEVVAASGGVKQAEALLFLFSQEQPLLQIQVLSTVEDIQDLAKALMTGQFQKTMSGSNLLVFGFIWFLRRQ
jgi:hypothetical protein